jgi:putative endonuclease
MKTQDLGKLGESLAENYLSKKGYKIIERNVRFKKWEVDLIAEYTKKIIIIEVKARQTGIIGEPWQAVTRSKQRQIITCANHYIQKRNIEKEVRFDVVSIILNQHRTEIEHIENAFYPF